MNGGQVSDERVVPGGWGRGFLWGLFGGSLVFLAFLAVRRGGRGEMILRLSWGGANVELIHRWWPE